jgi:hypothetical protein
MMSPKSPQIGDRRRFDPAALYKRAAMSRAILTYSALVGAMALPRAVSDEALSLEILNSVAEPLKNLGS